MSEIIKVCELGYTYPREHIVFEGLNFSIQEGEFWGVLGKNGSGKTTLLDLFLGIKYPSKGSVSLLGESPNEVKRDFSNEVSFLSQDITLRGSMKVCEFLEFHSFFYPKYSKEKESDLIQYFEIDSESLIGSLSTGQQKKVQVIAGFSSDTKLILIDEITAVLDPEARFKFFDKLTKLNKEMKKTIVLATNIAEDLEGRISNLLYINNFEGQIIDPRKIKDLFKTNG